MFGLFWAAAILLGAAGTAKIIEPGPAARALGARRPVTSGVAVSNVSHVRNVVSVSSVRVAVRVAGVGELGVAVAAVLLGGRWPALLLAAAYALLAVVAARMVAVAPGQDCGCFGTRVSPASHWHTAVNVVGAVVGLTAVLSPTRGLLTELGRQPLAGLPVGAGALLLAWLGYQLMTALPELNRARALVASSP